MTDSTSNWDAAYNDKINSAAVTGTTTKTLTLTQQDGGTILATWTDDNTDAVTSVFGRTGAVVANSGDYNTSQVTENTNLYYTDTRARLALSGSTGISYNNTTGVITSTITQYTDALARAAISESVTGLDYNNTTGVLSTTSGYAIPTTASQATWDAAYNDKINSAAVTGTTTKTLTLTQQDGGTITASWTDINTDAVTSVFGRTGAVVATSGDYTTAQVTESGNLYYTDTRARLSISASTGISYNNTTGAISSTITQYTDALARAALSFVAGSGAYNGTTGVITIPTNNNQITNGAGYITSYTETDTLASVVGRGSTTTATISVGDAGLGTTGVNIRRGRLSFSTTYEANHSIYNNYNNIDSEGVYDGIKMNVYNGLKIRTGNAAGVVPTTIFSLDSSGVAITGNVTATNLSGTNTGDQTLTGLGGVPTSRTLTINGTGYDLSADRSWSVTGTDATKLPLAGGVLTGSVTSNLTNGYGFVMNRPAITNYIGMVYQTAAINQWFVGLREISTNHYYIFNEVLGTNALIIDRTNNAATFSSSVMVNGSTVSNEGLSVQYNQAKTYTTQTAVSRWHSNEASGSQFKLNLFAIGNATSSSRVFKFQTSNEGVANDGIIAFQTDGGNVGIGTTSPSYLLDVSGTGRFTGALTGTQITSSYAGKDGLVVADTRTQAAGVGGSILFQGVYTNGGSPLSFGRISLMKENSTNADYSFGMGFYTSANNGSNPSTNPNFYIAGSGNVGIGTSSPATKLHIYGTGANTQTILQESTTTAANAYLVQKSTTKSYVSGLSTDFSNSYIIYDDTAAAARLVVTTGGNVLIGTSTDAGYKLDVNGSLNLGSTGGIFFNTGLALFPYGGHTYIRPYSASGNINFQNQAGNLLVTMLDGGNVGIGTGGAASKLTIYDGDVRLYKPHVITGGESWKAYINFTDEIDRLGARIVGERTAWDGAPMAIGFDTGGVGSVTRRMTISSIGNIGIGGTPLQALDFTLTNYGTYISNPSGGGGNYNENFRANRAGNGYSAIAMGGANGSVSGTGTGIWTLVAPPVGEGYRFYFDYAGVDKLSIQTNGNILLGASENSFGSAKSIQINGSGGSLLETRYNGTSGLRIGSGSDHSYHHDPRNAEMRFATSDSTRFYIYGNGNYSFTGSNVSDRRAKENIFSLDISATDKIMALQAKTYNMKNNPTQKRYGFIAQDVREILSDLVIGNDNDGYLGLDYDGLLSVAIKALQEQNIEIQKLKNK